MNRKNISVAGPSITDKEIKYVEESVREGWYEKAGYYISMFESEFKKFIGRKYAVALPSCTSALHLALASIGIKEGDEVIVPESTWIATSAPITYLGAFPVFADIDPNSWCISAESVENYITPKTKAIITVDLYGNMCNYDDLLQITEKHNITLIEDAAQAIGSKFRGRYSGAFGSISTFSFHGTKTLTTGEGGILLTDDELLFERINFLRDHGRSIGEKMFWNTEIAYKYKMTNMQAALGLAQLERINELISKKKKIFELYKRHLEGIDGISLNKVIPGVDSIPWMVTLSYSEKYGFAKEFLISKLKEEMIDTRPFFYPLSSLPAYKNFQIIDYSKRNLVAYNVSQYAINLPSNLIITEDEISFVCEILKKIFIS